MLNVVVLVSGGGTNLQAIIDAVDSGVITNTKIAGVISNNKNAYALERAEKHGIPNQCISPKDYESREIFNQEFMKAVDALQPDLIVLAGFLVVIPAEMIAKYRNRMINIHPSLIPSFCGTGNYGLTVHENALARGVKQGITEKAKARPAFYRGTIMNIDLVFKIAATGIIVAVLNQLLTRSGREDQAMMTTLAGLIVVLSMLVRQISDLFVLIKALFDL